jgi:thiol-disulfide isomerase/thioredoxin
MKKYIGRTIIVLLVVGITSFTIMSFTKSKQKTGVNIGDIAPEISLNGPDGKPIKLSSLRGKYVVLDFWASWCGPCRRANPGLVRIYKAFSTKNFDNGRGLAVYSVSLDKEKAAWLAAIKEDKLEWQEHVCDFMGWQSKTAAIFGVESIPTNFILDGEGKIIAIDLQDALLNKFLTAKEKK